MTSSERTSHPSPASGGGQRPPGVGVIGLGTMGGPIAGHILEAGLPTHVTARRLASAETLVGAGARWHSTARALAERCGVVVVMVPDLPDVEDVLHGPDGLLAGVMAPLLLVISSTVSPDGVRRLDEQLRSTTGGLVHVVDAPVSGGQEGAEAGTLVVMVGGSPADVQVAGPVLRSMGTVAHLGPIGAGQVAKACNQMVVAATVLALGEASVVAERAGLDVAAMLDLLSGGFAGSRVLDVKKTRFITHDHSPSGAAKYMVKDLSFASDEARLTGTVTPQLDALHSAFTRLTEHGFGDQDTAVVQAWIESLNPPS